MLIPCSRQDFPERLGLVDLPTRFTEQAVKQITLLRTCGGCQ
jgi:hypothetical protein